METSEEKKWARTSLLETGDESARDNMSETSTLRPQNPPSETGQKRHSTSVRSVEQERVGSHNSTSTRQPRYSDHRQRALGDLDNGSEQRSSVRLSSEIPTSTAAPSTYNSDISRRRGNSLGSRFAGDQSHQPLDIIRRDSRRAHRAPHLRKQQHHGADTIDKLAGLDVAYHHEGPYDAASLARNRSYKNSPLQAIEGSNREALKAVPRERIVDSTTRHRPLDGFAFVPPGIPDQHGRVLRYEEGTDMQRANGGDYRRWPGIDYHPDDLKGKGEPSYSIEKALKNHKHGEAHRRVISEGGIEMNSGIERSRSLHVAGSGNEPRYSEWESELRNSGNQPGAGIMRKLGSLRRRKPVPRPDETLAE